MNKMTNNTKQQNRNLPLFYTTYQNLTFSVSCRLQNYLWKPCRVCGEVGGEIIEKELVIQEIIDTLPGIEEMLRGEFSCNRKNLYEVMIMG